MQGGNDAKIEYELQQLHKVQENDILYKKILSKIHPIIVDLVQNIPTATDLVENEFLYKTAILSLCKLMCISQRFCNEHLELIFQLIESDISEGFKLNLIVAFGDFIDRFPNLLQPYVRRYFNL